MTFQNIVVLIAMNNNITYSIVLIIENNFLEKIMFIFILYFNLFYSILIYIM